VSKIVVVGDGGRRLIDSIGWPVSYVPFMKMLGEENLWGEPSGPPLIRSKPLKNCLRKACGKEHSHNNCFCSSECAKLWKKEKQNESLNSN
jgi:hypothetical protein